MAGRRVLIIEPDDGFAGMVEGFLRSSRFEVARARDVEQGRWLAALIHPQVVLVDSFPDDGEETARRFRSDGSVAKVPLVMMVPEDIEDKDPKIADSLRELYDGFLYKPFADTELLRVVENFTGFGDGEEAEGVLDNIVKEQSANPELRDVVEELKRRNASGKDAVDETELLAGKVAELEAELASAKEKSKRQADRITHLLNRISELELDESFAIESVEAEKKRLKNEIEALEKHIENLEKSQRKAVELLVSAIGVLKGNF